MEADCFALFECWMRVLGPWYDVNNAATSQMLLASAARNKTAISIEAEEQMLLKKMAEPQIDALPPPRSAVNE